MEGFRSKAALRYSATATSIHSRDIDDRKNRTDRATRTL